jgi:hypothetical protein
MSKHITYNCELCKACNPPLLRGYAYAVDSCITYETDLEKGNIHLCGRCVRSIIEEEKIRRERKKQDEE